MAIKNCRECGKEVSDKAKICPHCGINAPVLSPNHFPLIGLAIVFLFILFTCSSKPTPDTPLAAPSAPTSSNTDSPPPISNAPEPIQGHQPVDTKFPIFTQSIGNDSDGAMICPEETLLDERVGHGFKGLMNAKESIFSHQEKIAAVGCEELRGGIPVYFEANELQRIATLQSSNKVGFIDVQFIAGVETGKIIFSGDLTNNPSGKYGEKYTPTKPVALQSIANPIPTNHPAETVATESQTTPPTSSAEIEPAIAPTRPNRTKQEQQQIENSVKQINQMTASFKQATDKQLADKSMCRAPDNLTPAEWEEKGKVDFTNDLNRDKQKNGEIQSDEKLSPEEKEAFGKFFDAKLNFDINGIAFFQNIYSNCAK